MFFKPHPLKLIKKEITDSEREIVMREKAASDHEAFAAGERAYAAMHRRRIEVLMQELADYNARHPKGGPPPFPPAPPRPHRAEEPAPLFTSTTVTVETPAEPTAPAKKPRAARKAAPKPQAGTVRMKKPPTS